MAIPLYTPRQFRENRPVVSPVDYPEEKKQVEAIVEAVRRGKDAALKEYTKKFDGAVLEQVEVPAADMEASYQSVTPEIIAILKEAAANIESFHLNQVEQSWWDCAPGRITGQLVRPIRSAGAYIPGGTAAYPLSVLMTVIPARVAGVKKIYICTPPDTRGSVNPLTLAAAREAGASAVFRVGGAQAVAALAYGTETVPAVEKIVGPGNIYVTLAKKAVFGQVGIDMLAGPSEIAVVADERANPAYIAADLLSQAEHDPSSRAFLITPSEDLALRVNRHLEEQLSTLPRRAIASESLGKRGAAIIVTGLEEAWSLVNDLAPEHLELHLEQAWQYLDRVSSAGAVFLGPFSPEPLGDYWAGSNHVLPTGGAARFASPLGVGDFLKKTHVISYTAEALAEAAPKIAALAREEGLEAHARSVLVRRNKP